MTAGPQPRSRSWYRVPVRILLVTFIGTLLSFALALLVAIAGTLILSAVRGMHPDMRIAYRHIAAPVAGIAAVVIFVLAIALEVRHYRQIRTLAAIERIS